MSKYIKINEEFRVNWTGDQYALERWSKGGKEVRNPRTGETTTTESKWQSENRFFTSMPGAVEYVIKVTASDRADDLADYVNEIRALTAELKAVIDGEGMK